MFFELLLNEQDERWFDKGSNGFGDFIPLILLGVVILTIIIKGCIVVCAC